MGILNRYFKQKWIKDLQKEPYNLSQEQAKNLIDKIEHEREVQVKDAIETLSKRLNPSDNNDLKKDSGFFEEAGRKFDDEIKEDEEREEQEELEERQNPSLQS